LDSNKSKILVLETTMKMTGKNQVMDGTMLIFSLQKLSNFHWTLQRAS